MIRSRISQIISDAVSRVADGLGKSASEWPTPEVQDSKSAEFGDFATNFAMVASKSAGMNPRALAELLVAELGNATEIANAEVAGPGFVNLYLQPTFISGFVSEVVNSQDFGTIKKSNPQKINVEFVSVNPNGPITIGSGRGAAFGSVLCNVLEASGDTVHREYYINDGVNSEQMRLFAESVMSYCGLLFYGEWETIEDVTDPDSIKLDLLNEFLQSLGAGQQAQSEEVFFSQYKTFSGKHSAEAAAMVDRNINDADYIRNRPTQLKRLYGVAWQGGQFEPITPSFPEKGYKGDYVFEVAKQVVNQDFVKAELRFQERDVQFFREASQDLMIAAQRTALTDFRVQFDTWFSEQSLHESGQVAKDLQELTDKRVADNDPYRTIIKLGKKGVIEEVKKEKQAEIEDEDGGDSGTIWLRSTKFGDDMDRVLRRGDGRLTYISSDVAYHKDKFNRPPGTDRLITVLGPDHHGYIARLHAVLAALELASARELQPAPEGELFADPEEAEACRIALDTARRKLDVVIFQIVRFMKDGKPAPMRKRDGNIYALSDLVQEIGKSSLPEGSPEEQVRIGADVTRFFYLMRSHDTAMDFDLDLASKQSDENPVFYVQYAHARICTMIDKAAAEGHKPSLAELNLLVDPRELALIKKVLDLPFEVERSAADQGVHRIATYCMDLARAFHHFYDACRVIQPENAALTSARLSLCDATRVALRSAFKLLGISAPEKM